MSLPGERVPLTVAVDAALADRLTERLVEENRSRSPAVDERFQPGNLASVPVHAFAVADDGTLLGGCVGRIERVWHWLTVDVMWVDPSLRGHGLGRALLRAVEDEGRAQGCRWSDVSTFDFQAPGFYRAAGYEQYGAKADYPPGHTNYLFRKDL